MNVPFKEEYWKIAFKGIETLESIDDWEVVDREGDINGIDAIWAFKLKGSQMVWSRSSKQGSVLEAPTVRRN